MSRRKKGMQYYWRWYYHYRRQLLELALTIFKWENLPDTISERWIEMCLIRYGRVLFCKSSDFGIAALQVADGGRLDETFTPMNYQIVTPTVLHKDHFDNKNSVLCYNNYLRNGLLFDIEGFAQDLAQIKATTFVNIMQQKTPRLNFTNDSKKLSMIKALMKMDEYEPTIVLDKDMIDDMQASFNSVDTSAPFVADKLTIQKNAVWNEAMTFLGINNANQDKKERMNSKETESNNSQVMASLLTMLKERQIACNRVNKMFNLNISVTSRERWWQFDTLSQEVKITGGDNNASQESNSISSKS